MPNQTPESMKVLLQEILENDRKLLTDRDALIARLNEQVTGAMMRDFASLKIALQKNVGERFFAADGASEEEWETVCDDVRKQLIQSGMQEKRVDSVVEAFSYALRWKGLDSAGEAEAYNSLNDEKAFSETLETEATESVAMKEAWTCICGSINDGNYCIDCGLLRQQSKQNQQPSSMPVEASVSMKQESDKQTQTAFSMPEATSADVGISRQSNGLNKKNMAIAAGVLVLGGIIYFMAGSGTKLRPVQPVQTASQSSSSVETQNPPAEKPSPRLPVTEESTLGGLKIGDSDDKMHKLLGQETRKVRGEANMFDNYRFGNDGVVSVCFKDTAKNYDYIFRICAKNNSSMQTDRGIHIGSTIQEMLKVYDDNYKKSEDLSNHRATYVYEFAPPMGNDPGKLIFTSDTTNQKIVAIELSMSRRNIPVPKDFKGEGEVLAEMAINVLKSYHQAITQRDFQTAYNFFSPEEQKAHGSLETYTRGYANTLSSEIVEAKPESFRGEAEWKVHYRLKARDREGKRVKVLFFEGTAIIKLSGKSGKIMSMESKKVSEGYE